MSQNVCAICKVDLGPNNARQLCSKTYCPYENYYLTQSTLKSSQSSHSTLLSHSTLPPQSQSQPQSQSPKQQSAKSTHELESTEEKEEYKKSDIRSFFKRQ
jgi:hypothetical protein